MITKLKAILVENKRLFSDMFLVTFASIISSFLSYYLNFYVQSTYVDVVDFANYSLFITFIGMVSLLPNTISTSIIMTVTELKSQEKFQELFDLFQKLISIFLLISIIFFLIIYRFQDLLNQTFRVELNNFFMLSGIYLLFFILTIPISAFIYGMMKFKSFSFLTIATILIKILGIGYFYSQGYGFYSIFYAFIASAIFYILFGSFVMFSNLERPKIKISSKSLIGRVFLFSIPLLFISLGKDMITYLDFLIVKAKFDTVLSGNYSLLINIGKIFLFGSLIILGVMMPQIADAYNKGENYFKKFKIYLIIELVIVFIGLLCFGIFPKYIVDFLLFISNLIGLNAASFISYYNVVDLLPFYSIFISLIVLINLFTIFLIAIQKLYVFIFFILVIVLQGLGIYYLSANILNVIICNIICASSLLGYLVYETYKQYESFNNNSSL
jgi:O-antigen/teichoic acid export membrane protein